MARSAITAKTISTSTKLKALAALGPERGARGGVIGGIFICRFAKWGQGTAPSYWKYLRVPDTEMWTVSAASLTSLKFWGVTAFRNAELLSTERALAMFTVLLPVAACTICWARLDNSGSTLGDKTVSSPSPSNSRVGLVLVILPDHSEFATNPRLPLSTTVVVALTLEAVPVVVVLVEEEDELDPKLTSDWPFVMQLMVFPPTST